MTELPSNSGHRKRLRDKFINSGANSLHDYELLELLLTYAIPRRDVKPLAKLLLLRFKSITGIANATSDELTEIPGMGENSAALIMLIRAFGVKYFEERSRKINLLANPQDAIRFARMKIGGNSKETFMIIFLGSQNQMLSYDCFSEGTVNRAAVYYREVVELCLKRKAISVIIAHNHPSGFAEPSKEDIQITANVSNALKAVGIKLYDHIILTEYGFYSFATNKQL